MKTQTKSRALLIVCVLALVMALTAVFVVGASAADVTDLTDYSIVLNDGVDIKVNGTVAEADLEKEIKVVTTCHGETTYDVTVEDGAFSVVIPVSATRFADTVKVDLVVDDEIVATEQVSVKAYIAATLADEEAPVILKQLVSNLTVYGAAVLNKLGATEEMEAFVADLAIVDDYEPEWEPAIYLEEGEENTVAFTQISMELDGRINLIFTTDAAVDGYNVIVDGYDVEIDGTSIKVVGIPVSAFFAPITVGVYEDETLVSDVTVAPATYAMLFLNNEENAAEEDMAVVGALTYYAAVAHEYTTHKMVETVETVATCQGTGLKTITCEGCGHYEEIELESDPAVHSEITYTVENNNITYTCAGCEKTWTSTSLMLADGANTNAFEGNPSTNVGFVGGSAGFPNIVDGYYEFVKAETPAASQGQFYIKNKVTGGTVSNNATNRFGFVSISLQATDVAFQGNGAPWALKLCNSGGAWSGALGTLKGMDILSGVAEDGSKAKTMGGVIIDLAADGFTRIDISFVPVENNQYLLTYYVDGVAVDAVRADNGLKNYTPDRLYFTCGGVAYDAEADAQPTFRFDDLTFAFTDATASAFFPTNHVHTPGTEVEEIDDKTHGVKCQGCDVFVGSAAHEYDFSGAACGEGATGTCACGATTTKTIECTLVATGYENNVVTYECKNCDKAYTLNATKGSDCSAKPNFNIIDSDAALSVSVDGAYKHSASQTATNSNAAICAYPGVNSTTMLLGFDIKNTAARAGYFVIQWRAGAASWSFDGNETKLEIKPDGSIYFADKNHDTGVDISTTEFTSILMKATFTPVDDANTTLTIDLWVNGQYVGTATKTAAKTGCNWSDAGGAGAQICLENKKGTNEVILDNFFVGTTEATGTDITAYLTAK